MEEVENVSPNADFECAFLARDAENLGNFRTTAQ